MTASSDASPPSATQTEVPDPSGQALVDVIGPGHILLIALLVGLFSVVWFGSYQLLDNLVWDNSFVAANRWALPVGLLFFSLLVGLAQKYLHAPNSIEGEALSPVLAGDTTSHKNFWGTLVTSLASLLSGSSVGPEGPLGYLAVDVSEWLALKLKLAKQAYLPACMSGMSAAYNGLIGNSIFTAVMATETSGGKSGFPALAANLAGEFQQLPEGWAYRVDVPDEDLVMNLSPDAPIPSTRDEFDQIYIRIPQ